MQHIPTNGRSLLEARLLGGCVLRYHGRAVPATAFKRRRSLTLLLFLLSTPRHQASRADVLELLWPDKHAPESTSGLRVVLSDLRAGLGESPAYSPVVVVGQFIALHPDLNPVIDADTFEAVAREALDRQEPAMLREAAALYTGEFLPDRPYEDWALRRREQLSRLHDQVLSQLVGMEQRDDPLAAENRLRALLAAEPSNEKAARRLMRLLAAHDRRADAVRVYRALTAALHEDLDVPPSAETERLRVELFGPAALPNPTPASRSETNFMTNLPRQTSSLVGREWEIAEVKGLVLQPPSGCRLLTLIGPGGCGKTRLAIEATRAVAPEYPSGVWWVDLAELADASLLPRLIVGAVGGEVSTWAVQAEGALIEALQHKRMVLVLDTCEHLVEPLAALISTLLRGCPQLRILATSREALAVAGEITWPVPPLGLPPEPVIRGRVERMNPSLAPADLIRYGAIQLFYERVRAIDHGFVLTDRNAATIAAICRRLEGIPLAIELAAAQLRRLTVNELAAQLADQLYLFENNDQAALPRHRTLNAVMDWSYALLDEPERTLLQRLSVFLGGWTLEAAEAVCAGGALTIDEVAPCLGRLVDRSLASIEETHTLEDAAPTRYRMLETVRQYAQARLDALSSAALRRAHADYFIRLATHAELTMVGPDWKVWLKRLEQEQDNLHAARSWVQMSADQSMMRVIRASEVKTAETQDILEAQPRITSSL